LRGGAIQSENNRSPNAC